MIEEGLGEIPNLYIDTDILEEREEPSEEFLMPRTKVNNKIISQYAVNSIFVMHLSKGLVHYRITKINKEGMFGILTKSAAFNKIIV
ncbi:hypothetical protein LCGC14_2520930 [marine sediment metagenome]|uniref:Uncharacterized protein n=1 Tax=marine sediment metagenome TaxID=412755 RepID=A0A0F9AWT8_9ZZZZ